MAREETERGAHKHNYSVKCLALDSMYFFLALSLFKFTLKIIRIRVISSINLFALLHTYDFSSFLHSPSFSFGTERERERETVRERKYFSPFSREWRTEKKDCRRGANVVLLIFSRSLFLSFLFRSLLSSSCLLFLKKKKKEEEEENRK